MDADIKAIRERTANVNKRLAQLREWQQAMNAKPFDELEEREWQRESKLVRLELESIETEIQRMRRG